MGDNRARALIMDWHRTPAGMLRYESSRFKWRCHGCAAWTDFDKQEAHDRLGPEFPMWCELSRCPRCDGVRTLHGQPGPTTPYLPMVDRNLKIFREVGYGRDPDAWFEIDWWGPVQTF